LAGAMTIGAIFVQSTFAADVADQRLTVIQTSKPSVMPAVGVPLPASGAVRIIVNVDASGTLVDCMLLDYTNERYANAALDAVKDWQYKPATYRGTPIATRTVLDFAFQTTGQATSMTCLDMWDAYLKGIIPEKPIKCVVPMNELDAQPRPIHVVSPALAKGAGAQGGSSRVCVDFYIDETGKPRMPAVDVGENDSMADASLEAILQWRFSPPTSKGRAVTVRATQWFDFTKAVASTK